MASRLTALIDKRDSFEIIRDQIAQVLADESANQMALATAASRDPELWRLRVYRERAVPWDLVNGSSDRHHAVNVWFDSANIDEASADPTNRQSYIGNFNIDVVYEALSVDTASGQTPGDMQSALQANRILRLCRNILMSSEYTYLRLRQTESSLVAVTRRWIRSISTFQPQLDNKAARHVTGMRLELSVRYSEFSPQYEPSTLNVLDVVIDEDDMGQVLAGVQLDFTT